MSSKIHLPIVLFLAVVVFTANIWGVDIYFLDEAKNAGCAMEMYAKGEWIVPTFNNELRTDKPPLHYFLMKAGYTLFGVTPGGARFFSSVMGVLTTLAVFLFVRKIVNSHAALYASLILISSIQFAIQMHTAVPDPYLLFFLTAGWLSFYYGWYAKQRKFIYLFYFLISLAFLTKGPVAIVFSGLIVLVYLITMKDFSPKSLLQLRPFEGLLIFCLVGLPWYVAVGIETNGAWIDHFFFKHNAGRFMKTMEGHGGFPLASFVIMFAGLMPFSFFLPQAVKWYWKNRDPFVTYCVCVAMVILIFFAFSRTILPTYPEPAFPFVACLLGVFFMKLETRQITVNGLWINGMIYSAITLLFPAGAYVALKQDFNVADLTPLSFLFVIIPIGAFVALVFLKRSEISNAFLSYAASLILFLLLFFYIGFPMIDARNPVKKSLAVMDKSRPVFYYNEINPAYVFALKSPINSLADANQVREVLSVSGEGIYIITTKEHAAALDSLGLKKVFEQRDLFESATTVVLEKGD